MMASSDTMRVEMLTLTYGAVVAEIIKEKDGNIQEINKELDEFGFNIGGRLIDEFLARSNVESCSSFLKVGERIATLGFKMFLGIEGKLSYRKEDKESFSILFTENPLDKYVTVPEKLKGVNYSQMICGVIRGALEAINLRVSADFVKDMLAGADIYEIQVNLEERVEPKIIDYDD